MRETRAERIAARVAEAYADPTPDFTPIYERWRHGGWYVTNVRWPEGGCGCVSRNLVNPRTFKTDRKWRIVCDPRRDKGEDHAYPTRDAAALAERELTLATA